MLMRSTDNGVHWSPPQVLNTPEEMVITPNCAIVKLWDGRWL